VDDDKINVDVLTINIAPADRNRISYTVVHAPEPGEVFIENGGPIQPVSGAKTRGERALAKATQFNQQPMFVARAPGELRGPGLISKGDVLLSVPVRHAVT